MTVLWLETRVLELDAPLPDDIISIVHVVNFRPETHFMRAVVMTRHYEPDVAKSVDPLNEIQVTIDDALEEE